MIVTSSSTPTGVDRSSDGILVHEDLQVRAEPALFVDHPEAHPRVPAVEIGEHLGDAGPLGIDHLGLRGVGAQRRGHPYLHRSAGSGSAHSTE